MSIYFEFAVVMILLWIASELRVMNNKREKK